MCLKVVNYTYPNVNAIPAKALAFEYVIVLIFLKERFVF